ncbi:hypothetical protein JQ554_24040 [Bradyrhizobium diazoefficiens]|nr:hypothetical protein [Bradyrhizobium diazoefficiens]MBR0977335.1 hypothetical protein [Bradyrhizobium diazoefficiens]MBR1007950.1 hypothetical protein [Bradyrhizobium diazoefficiens]MBR1013400.1 hypothetical protein [Bradyrhizobium diazoefficiens]MBR1051657.1 hypothetical protein [Bradyrhizobium diazoefficiens]
MHQDGRRLNERRSRYGAGAAARAVPGRRAGRFLLVVSMSLAAIVAADAWRALQAEEPKAKIVGLGATTCQRFVADVKANPAVRRDYLAWAQGFMSGIISSRPVGVDVGLDLAPETFDLIRQLQFLDDHCVRNVSLDFSDAVAALYKRLRQEGKT